MQVVLVMFRKDGQRRSFSLPRSVTVIGRREECDLRIPLGEVSRKHCQITKMGDGTVRLTDLESSNGTWLNGEKIHDAEVEPGDTIQVGPVVFVVQIDNMPPEDQLKPKVAKTTRGPRGAGAAAAQQPDAEFDPLKVIDAEEAEEGEGEGDSVFDIALEEIKQEAGDDSGPISLEELEQSPNDKEPPRR